MNVLKSTELYILKLCEFYLNLKMKKKEEEKERSGKFSLITIRTQVETGLV